MHEAAGRKIREREEGGGGEGLEVAGGENKVFFFSFYGERERIEKVSTDLLQKDRNRWPRRVARALQEW